MLDNDSGGDGPDEDIRIIAVCADCGCPMVAAPARNGLAGAATPHPDYPVLCRPCGDGFKRLSEIQRAVFAGRYSDFPGEDHIQAMCGVGADETRLAPTIAVVLWQLWQTWRWWFEGEDGGVAA